MTRHLLAISAALLFTSVGSVAFACNYDTVVNPGALPVCFDVYGGCGELTLESTCTSSVTFEEVNCTQCGATQVLNADDIITYPLALPEAVEGAQATQEFRWESEGTQAFIDVTTTYSTTADVACTAARMGQRTPYGGGFGALLLLAAGLLWRRRHS